MLRPLLAFACIVAIALDARGAAADPPGPIYPIYVTLVGQGAVRVRLTAGVVAPCDSSDDAPVYDGWLAPGRYRFFVTTRSVCMQHTWGAFRDDGGDWSTPAILPTAKRTRRFSGSIVPYEIRLSTEAPYA
jgi:hypothetical protein